ncbi:dicarboxylate/amino acid:cation symporter [Halodesulfovibrio sp.]|uniref:dicarboxylate/amino acid:cation symporter n=1 Tax=Halodesulfovibrio sp. TaxID=1912772 RepID=UPI0025EF5642|nr:dicarboxylate/amino acid:cation symporter [Halodesulfovibrio sp.]MCT4534274.1 dicarboxylate/amino acid:cation symporter [Halodesulfovibrio sp.]MCT4627113.1 dicarboxylate/amino acid:cation symporter [Halodesulfovibrio sp.]
MKLWTQILIGMIVGVIIGAVAPACVPYVAPVGTLFINAIKMLIVPLVFASLVTGMTSMDDVKKLGRISFKTIGIYLTTTLIAISIGLIVGELLQPGAGMNLAAAGEQVAKEAPSLSKTLTGLIPKNPIDAMVKGNILQIIIFAIFLGLSINLAGEKGAPVKNFFASLAEVMYSMTGIVMACAPYGVAALIAKVVGQYGLDALLPLAKIIGAVYFGAIIHVLITYSSYVTIIARLSPVKFFRGILDALMVAFSTTSSAGTLPATIRCTEKNLGVSPSIASFVLPLGATINMDGTAIYQGVCALFIAQAYNIDLTMGNIATIMLTGTLASIGTAGVPGAGLIMLSLILSSVGLPMEGIALIAGIDRVLDMARTTVNISGDAMTAVLVSRTENELDEEVYNAG